MRPPKPAIYIRDISEGYVCFVPRYGKDYHIFFYTKESFAVRSHHGAINVAGIGLSAS